MKIHKSVTLQRVMEAVREDDSIGFCINCGEEAYGCEPDMTDGTCELCGAVNVHGAEELLFIL